MEWGRWRAESGAEGRWKTKDTDAEQDAATQKPPPVLRGSEGGEAVDGKNRRRRTRKRKAQPGLAARGPSQAPPHADRSLQGPPGCLLPAQRQRDAVLGSLPSSGGERVPAWDTAVSAEERTPEAGSLRDPLF